MGITIGAPEQAATAFADAWSRHDMDGSAVRFGCEFRQRVGIWWKNRSEIEAAHRATHDTIFRDSRLTGDVSSVVELAPGLAAVHYTWTLTGARAPDGSSGLRTGILLLIGQQGPSGWLIKVAQNTDIVPGVAAPPNSRN